AAELELEVACAGVLAPVGDAALAFDLVGKADRMSDGDAVELPPRGEKLRDIVVGEIGRQPRIEPRDVASHAVKKIGAGGAQDCVQDRLVDLRRSKGRRQRRDVFACASFELRWQDLCMQAEGSV